MAGNLRVNQGYLTYTIRTIDSVNNTSYKGIVDSGNGKVLYASEDKDVKTFGYPPFGKKGHGFGFRFGSGPFDHEGFAHWNSHGFDGGPWHGPFGR